MLVLHLMQYPPPVSPSVEFEVPELVLVSFNGGSLFVKRYLA